MHLNASDISFSMHTGHSMGGSMSMYFTATHPKMVKHLVSLDSFKPATRKPEDLVERTRDSGMGTVISVHSYLNSIIFFRKHDIVYVLSNNVIFN